MYSLREFGCGAGGWRTYDRQAAGWCWIQGGCNRGAGWHVPIMPLLGCVLFPCMVCICMLWQALQLSLIMV